MDKKEWCQSVLLTLLGLILTVGLLIFLAWLASFVSGPICIYVLVLSVGGGFGGLCSSLIENRGHLKLCRAHQYEDKEDKKDGKPDAVDKKPSLDLGCIADILIGIGSAFAIFLVVSSLVKLNNDIKSIEPSTIFTLASLGIVAGAGGKYIFPMLVQKMEAMIKTQEKAEEAIRKALDAKEEATNKHKESLNKLDTALVAVGNALMDSKDSAQPENAFNKALEANPRSALAKVGLAMLRKRQKHLPEAIDLCTQAIEFDANYAIAYYNRACYKNLSSQPLSQVIDDLRKAIELDESLRVLAKADEDFDSIKSSKEFLEIVNTSK